MGSKDREGEQGSPDSGSTQEIGGGSRGQETIRSIKNQYRVFKNSMVPRWREFRFSLFLMRKSLLAMTGIVIVLAILIIALAAPFLAPPAKEDDPRWMPRDFSQPKPPGAEDYILGTGKHGVDIYYGVIWGARTSLEVALFVVFVASVLGIVLGAMAGYFGGKVDELLMRVTDIFLSIPGLILAMAVAAILERNLDNIMLALIVVWWPPYARLVRGQVLSVRENTYVEAARAVGSKRNRVLFKHVVPNSLAPMLVAATMDLGVVVLVAAGLSYIGFGPPSGTAEWGKMVSDGQEYFLSTVYWEGEPYNPWWMWVFPGTMIFLFVMGFNLFGDGLRDILDPRLRR
ncbi:MAG: ABC transporter permease [Methanomassiliicoccales archaeon]